MVKIIRKNLFYARAVDVTQKNEARSQLGPVIQVHTLCGALGNLHALSSECCLLLVCVQPDDACTAHPGIQGSRCIVQN
jgi:hypothetical protein